MNVYKFIEAFFTEIRFRILCVRWFRSNKSSQTGDWPRPITWGTYCGISLGCVRLVAILTGNADPLSEIFCPLFWILQKKNFHIKEENEKYFTYWKQHWSFQELMRLVCWRWYVGFGVFYSDMQPFWSNFYSSLFFYRRFGIVLLRECFTPSSG